MPKYVLKEDVENNLVDPTKPLEEQPEYKKKIDQEAEQRHKHQESKQHIRPKKERPPRNKRPVFNWNKKDVTLDSKPPEKPKKLLERPDRKKHQEGMERLKAEREQIKEEKRGLIEEQKRSIRYASEAERTGKRVINQFSGELGKKYEVERQMRKEIKALDDAKLRVKQEHDFLTAKVDILRRPSDPESLSAEYLERIIIEKERTLNMAGSLSKQEEAHLNKEINALKRALPKARSHIEIETEIRKLQDQADILYKELKGIKYELHLKITEANAFREEINALREQKESEKDKKEDHQTVEAIRAEYDIKLKKLEEKRDKLEDRIDDYVDKHTRETDDYEDQQDLLKYIEWVEKQVRWLQEEKEEEERRKKEREALEKKRQKEKEDWEKKKEQRKLDEEKRKVRDEARKAEFEKAKEAYINRNPNWQEIEYCESLIGYCERLRPAVYRREEKAAVPASELVLGKDWQKEVKGGA
jgi:hypothetical protein